VSPPRWLCRSLLACVPAALTEVITPGRTLTKRAADVPAYSTHPHVKQPDEAINGRIEHGSALGFRNLTNYNQARARSRCLQATATPRIVKATGQTPAQPWGNQPFVYLTVTWPSEPAGS
jgi:hypothetical protein